MIRNVDWWFAIAFLLLAATLDAASEKGDGKTKKDNGAPPEKFDWDKFFKDLNFSSKAETQKNNTWDLFKNLLMPHEGDEASCTNGYSPYRNGCYKVSKDSAAFTKCQKICEDDGGSLAAVADDWMDEFLWNLVASSGGLAQYGTYIGLYHDMNSRSDLGEWVDGSSMSYTNHRSGEERLESNLGCSTSSCATMIPSCYWCEDDPGRPRDRGWDQIRCIREQHCLCEQDRYASISYQKSVSTLDWPEFLTSAQPIYFRIGWGCVGLLIWALVGTCLVTRRSSSHPRANKYLNVSMGKDPRLSYGELLDTRGDDVEGLVNLWVVRGGCAASAYGVMLLALAFTTMIQNNGSMVRIVINAFEAFLMFACKATVGISAFSVHRHLSATSRAIAGPWVLIISISKMAMACGQLLMVFGYVRILLTFELCDALSLYVGMCMIGVISQSLAGFSLFRVYYRTVRRVGDREVFSRVVGCWWSALVGSTFGVGIGLWWSGAEFMSDADSGLMAMPIVLLMAAACQLTAGLSMLRANQHIRAFFKSPEGKEAFADLTESVRSDPSGSTELRMRVGRPTPVMEL
jgi:hypothetical protein